MRRSWRASCKTLLCTKSSRSINWLVEWRKLWCRRGDTASNWYWARSSIRAGVVPAFIRSFLSKSCADQLSLDCAIQLARGLRSREILGTSRAANLADDIERVRKTETRRGRRPVDIETLQERQRILAALREIWEYGTEEDLKSAMREFGLSDQSPHWIETLAVWSGERGLS